MKPIFLASGTHFLHWQLETPLFYFEFSLPVEIIVETWGKSIFKDEIYSYQWKTDFYIFSDLYIYIHKSVENGLQLQQRGYPIANRKWIHLNLNNGFHYHYKINPIPLIGKNSIRQKIYFHQPENPSFRLVETDFRANNGFFKKKEKL